MRTIISYQTHCLLLITLGLLVAVADQCAAQRLLIDDFSIDQQGIETDGTVMFDLLEDPRLFGGGREVWGGANGLCEDSTFAVTVADGAFQLVNGEDCDGAGAVTWPARVSGAAIDLSGYSLLQIDIDSIIGEVLTRVTVASDTSTFSRFDVMLSSPGVNVFAFPEDANLSRVNNFTIASELEQGEFLALNAVWLAVPEPRSILLFMLLATIGFAMRAYL